MRHKFERFGLIPENLRGFRHWRVRQRRNYAALFDRHRPHGRNHVFILIPENDAPNFRFQIGFVLDELFLQMISREFERDELMMIVRAARCRQRLVPYRVVAAISRRVIAACFASCPNLPVAFKIQTKLKTARMKTFSPIERTRRPKVVPLHSHAELINITVKRPPAIFDFAPGVQLGRALRNHCV